MVYLIVVAAIFILLILLLKWWNKNWATSGEKVKVSEKHKPEGIVGKSTFVLAAERTVPETGSSGRMEIEVPLEYEPDIIFIEEQEELEELALSTEFSSDITFEEMMEVVNEVGKVQPHNPGKAGKLLYENENSDWVEQMAFLSPDYQKRIVELIDLHLGSLAHNENKQVSDDGLEGFDIGEYLA